MTLLGVREPRLRSVPPYERTYGPDVVDLAAMAGLEQDPWQADVLDVLCAVSPTNPNRWNTLECAEIVSRQNGKGGNLEAYVLGCLFLFDDELTMYSAHRFATAREMFIRIKELITGCDELRRRVKRVSEAHGKEGIELLTGQRLLFYARSDKGGRGFSGDKNILDEAFLLDGSTMSAIMPTMSARRNPQIVYASSAGWEISTQLGKLRRRALASICFSLAVRGLPVEQIAEELGLPKEDVQRYLDKTRRPDPSLSFMEWSVRDNTPRIKSVLADPKLLAQANPALGIRITEEFSAGERRTMGAVEYARERLGVGDYPPDEDDEAGWEVISEEAWTRRAWPGGVDRPWPGEVGRRRVAFAAAARPDGSAGAIGAAFRDEDDRMVVEVINHRQGTGWMLGRFVELDERYGPCGIGVDNRGPVAFLIDALRKADVEVFELGTADIAQAYGEFNQAVTDTGDLAHLDDEPLNDAVRDAVRRALGDRFTWDNKADADICPLVAVTNAAFVHGRTADEDDDPLNNIW